MRRARRAVPALLLVLAAAPLSAAEVVVLKGGVRIELKEPWVQQGNTVILTRTDGTLLSVPASEIDTKATAAARVRKPAPAPAPVVVAPPSTPADAVRSGRGEKARVRVTDADVGHVETAAAAPVDRGAKVDNRAGAARIEVADYNQQKSGENLIITGTLHNNGTTPALNTRLTVSAIDETGNSFSTASATVANGTVEGGRGVNFSASLPVGERTPSQIRFVPQWQTPPPPAPPAAPAANGAAAPAAAPGNGAPAAPAKAPAPVTTPYGQGLLYAAPAPPAPNQPPADGKSGYIPGASSPDNQPKPPQ
ncbi:MAG TPA: FxLYD domain-containing protein [Thermoanaerobaculia bacterium]